MSALSRALTDTRELRHVFVKVELFSLLGLLVLFGNLYMLLASALLVASSLLGLDVGFVSALIAPDNELVLLLLLGLASLLLEPLRAAISAVAFQSARERAEAADLRALIDALPNAPPAAAGRARVSLLLMFVGSLLASPVHAEDPRAGSQTASSAWPQALASDATGIDQVARQKSQAILARSEFLPSKADAERGPVQAWLERRLRERERELSDHDLSTPPRFELRVPPLPIMLVSLVLMLGVGAWLARGMRSARLEALAALSRRAADEPTQAERLAEAAQLARDASYAEALRSLYAACLQALGRSEATHTNGQLLRQLAPGPLRAAFELLTLRFERCCYGRQQASRADYEDAHGLADQILQLAPASGQLPAAVGGSQEPLR